MTFMQVRGILWVVLGLGIAGFGQLPDYVDIPVGACFCIVGAVLIIPNPKTKE